MHYYLKQLPLHTEIILCIPIILLAGFFMTRITKRFKFPTVTGYILAGILIGPELLHLIPREAIRSFSFISDVALSFIAFDVGHFLKRDVLRAAGIKVIILTVFESVLAGVFVFLGMRYILNMDAKFSLLLGAIATATAPASTMMTIREYGAKGPYINTLLQVVALDDVVCLLIFSGVLAFLDSSSSGAMGVLLPVGLNMLIILLGYFGGIVLNKMMTPTRSNENRLLITVSFLLTLTGICQIVNVSPLLSAMVFGAGYRNRRQNSNLFREVQQFSPPLMAMFFIVSGMNLSFSAIRSLGLAGILYVILRVIGKYIGARWGAGILDYPENVRKYLGYSLVPQAGVALGLAFMGQRLLQGELGISFFNIILASSVIYEMIGPVLSKYSILKGAESLLKKL